MTDDTQQHRKVTEDELGALTTGDLTVSQWLLIGTALAEYVLQPVDYDLGIAGTEDHSAQAAELLAYIAERNISANRIMDVAAEAVMAALPPETDLHHHMAEQFVKADAWFSEPTGTYLVAGDEVTDAVLAEAVVTNQRHNNAHLN